MGRFEDAIAEGKKSVELDPANVMASLFLAYDYFFARRYDLAEAELKKAPELEPNYAPAHGVLALVCVQQEKYAEAIREAERYVSLGGRDGTSLSILASAYVRGSRDAEGRKVLQELEALSQKSYVAPYGISSVYASLNDRDRAFAWLEKAFAIRDPALVRLKVGPLWDSLRDDPRYADLVRRIGFPP
jgi:serine/threonine-protein kinase